MAIEVIQMVLALGIFTVGATLFGMCRLLHSGKAPSNVRE
jgi:hypothetical protein